MTSKLEMAVVQLNDFRGDLERVRLRVATAKTRLEELSSRTTDIEKVYVKLYNTLFSPDLVATERIQVVREMEQCLGALDILKRDLHRANVEKGVAESEVGKLEKKIAESEQSLRAMLPPPVSTGA